MFFTKALKYVAVVLLVVLLTCFIFRGRALQWAFDKTASRINQQYGVQLCAAGFGFSGLDKVMFNELIRILRM